MFEGMAYVYEVYKEMSFSKAAKNLYISQPSLSAAVKKAESRIGFPIFDRSTTPIGLTDLGREYIRSVEMIMDIENGFGNYVNDVNELKSGAISIGGTNLFASYILPPLLSRFTEKYPSVLVNLTEASTAELTERLFSGKLDLMIDNHYMDSDIFEKQFFCEEHLILAAPKKLVEASLSDTYGLTAGDIKRGHHLQPDVPSIPLKLLQGAPFLFLKSGNDTRTRADHICQESRFSPAIKLKLDQQVTAYNLSCYGMGISFTGDILIKHVPENENLIFFKLGSREATRDVNFYYKRSRYMTRTVKEFLRLLDGE
ncbi:LysR family transcriptional regulator [Lacrimispora sp. 210928-DFI.3.58]|uniref:LysR family transcriptional regulator n=1 Tax=Lacrimispora sp. 210928-DFI.3.58 TaxID=2883214 RepID=UPI001D087E06|nr:LysR family transcriptional regulator [Lacrimispora sp. 210928-DFI.3.58]MCB7317419.1 LysR family transcriptional regulator [Lacrimispora sp. 210928-DFI.3.58]